MSRSIESGEREKEEHEGEERWIEADFMKTGQEEDESDPDVSDLFADPDPHDQFDFSFKADDGKEIFITLHGYKAELGQTLCSTGLTLWRASEILCEYLVSNANLVKGKRVLELGAGLGMCGVLVHGLGALNVVLTDGDTDTLSQLRRNVHQNCGSTICEENCVSCRQLIWGHNLDDFVREKGGDWDVMIGSDIIYVEEILTPLWTTVERLLSHDGLFLLAYARRNVSIDLVFNEARRHGFVWESPKDAEGVFVFRRESLVSREV